MATNMDQKANNPVQGSEESIQEILVFFLRQVTLASTLKERIKEWDHKSSTVIHSLIYSILDSCESFYALVKNRKLRDAYVIARIIYETCVNLVYILAAGSSAAEKASRHALQKSIRDLDRKQKIGDLEISLKWSGEVDLSSIPDAADAMKEYTGKKGREITSWTSESLLKRIEFIGDTFGRRVPIILSMSLVAIYRYSSEIAHGTLYGAMFSIGLTEPNPPTNEEELGRHRRGKLYMLILLMGLCINASIIACAKFVDADDLVEESNKLSKEIRAPKE